MKYIPLATILVVSGIAAAYAAPPAQPAPEPSAKVDLTASDMQVISTALKLAAQQCAENTDACRIGILQAAINQKMAAGYATLQQKK
jgi:hypothetical protein